MAMSVVKNGEKNILGLTMIPDRESNMTYGLSAQYAPGSLDSEPVIILSSNYNEQNTEYIIRINDVNPNSASIMEMFALCCHADARGICDKGDFGTFYHMKQYMKNAVKHGMCEKVRGYKAYQEVKLNWHNIVNYMCNEFNSSRLYNQYCDALRHLDMIDYFYTRFYSCEYSSQKYSWVENDTSVNKVSDNSVIKDKHTKPKQKWQNTDTAEESYILGKNNFTLEEWRTFLNKFERIDDAIKALMKQEGKINNM